MSFTAYWNGEWVPGEEIRIDPLDRGFTVADATFEATRTFTAESTTSATISDGSTARSTTSASILG